MEQYNIQVDILKSQNTETERNKGWLFLVGQESGLRR